MNLRIIAVIFPLVFLEIQASAMDALLAEFDGDLKAVVEKVHSGDWEGAWIDTGAPLYKWKNHIEFPRFLDGLEKAYRYCDEAKLKEEYERRLQILKNHPAPVAWMDLALMKVALRNYGGTIEYLTEALEAPDFANNPFVHAFLGRIHLKLRSISSATSEYETAVELAEKADNPALLFRARHLYADDFFLENRIDQAVEVGRRCLDSSYPLERAWALGQMFMYEWSRNERGKAIDAYSQLSDLLPTVSPRADSRWEQNRFRQTREWFEFMKNAMVEDPVAQMIVDVEALDYEYRTLDYDRCSKRMKKWVEFFPIEDYGTWFDADLREWAVWAHLNYCTAEILRGKAQTKSNAEAGLRNIIDHVPFEEAPARVVDAWCWLGIALSRSDRLQEAKEAFEYGLSLDSSNFEASSAVLGGDLSQYWLKDGLAYGFMRDAFARIYRDALSRLKVQGESPGE